MFPKAVAEGGTDDGTPIRIDCQCMTANVRKEDPRKDDLLPEVSFTRRHPSPLSICAD